MPNVRAKLATTTCHADGIQLERVVRPRSAAHTARNPVAETTGKAVVGLAPTPAMGNYAETTAWAGRQSCVLLWFRHGQAEGNLGNRISVSGEHFLKELVLIKLTRRNGAVPEDQSRASDTGCGSFTSSCVCAGTVF
tara:strand:- start:147 stop:557 length:411 start_codon:yes stop_codon:yes gene_type:complete